MRYVIIAMLIYVVYLVIKSIIGRKQGGKTRIENDKKRSYDLNQVQDAEFREVNGDVNKDHS